MKTDAIVRRLVDDLRPVRPLRPVPIRLAQWSVAVLAVLGFELWVAIARGIDLSAVTGPALLAQAALPLGVALVAAAAALQQSIPGRADASLPTVSLVLFSLWVGVLATAVAKGPPP